MSYNPILDPIMWIILFIPVLVLGVIINLVFYSDEIDLLNYSKPTRLFLCVTPYSFVFYYIFKEITKIVKNEDIENEY